MKITLENRKKVSQFGNILKHLKHFSQDIEIFINEERLYAQGMDGSQAALFELVLKNDWFTSYEVDEEVVLGINCELISKVLHCLNNNQTITLEHDIKKDDLTISLIPREGEKCMLKEFKIPLFDLESQLMEIPDADYTADLEIESQEFYQLVDEMSIFGDKLEVNCTGEEVKFTGKGNLGSMTALIKEDDILMYAVEEDADMTVEYRMSYLKTFTSFSRINSVVKLHMSKNLPMKIQYDMDDVVDDDDEDSETQNFVRFFLAPVVEDF
jgi:proliferating cell nuclear antigen